MDGSELCQYIWEKTQSCACWAEDVLCAYWWQLLYSNQEMATQEMAIAQPLPGPYMRVSFGTSGFKRLIKRFIRRFPEVGVPLKSSIYRWIFH